MLKKNFMQQNIKKKIIQQYNQQALHRKIYSTDDVFFILQTMQCYNFIFIRDNKRFVPVAAS